MGNDSSRNKDPQEEPKPSPSSTNTQPPPEDIQEEVHPSLEAIHALYPQWDPNSYQEGQEVGEEQEEEEYFPSLLSEDLSVSATNSRSDDGPSQRRVWEEGQLLPPLPQTDLYIEGLEYKESGQSSQPGTISHFTSEDCSTDEEFSAAEDTGLIGILREWGEQVLPEKISKTAEDEKTILPEMPQADLSSGKTSVTSSGFHLQAQEKLSASEDSLEMQDVEADIDISSITHFKNNDAVIQSNYNLGSPTPQLIPTSAEISSRNAALSQPVGLLQEPDDTCNQAKNDCKDSYTDHGEQKGSWDSITLTTDGINSQTWGQSHLILPFTTDGSSDNDKDKLPIQSCLQSGESLIAESFEPNLVVSELNTFCDNLVTSLLNQQSLVEVTEPTSLQEQMGKITTYHGSPVNRPEESETKKSLDAAGHVNKTTLAENIANHEINEVCGLPEKSTIDSGNFPTKDMKNHEVETKALEDESGISSNVLIPMGVLVAPDTENTLCTPLTESLNEGINQVNLKTTAGLVDTSMDSLHVTTSSDLVQVVNQTSTERNKDIRSQSSVNNLLLEDVSNFCLNTAELHLAAPSPDVKEDTAKGLPISSTDQSLTSTSIGQTPMSHIEVIPQQNIKFSPLDLTGFTINMDMKKEITGEKPDTEYGDNDWDSSTQEKVATEGVTSNTHKDKALKIDRENSYLASSACPVIIGDALGSQVLPDSPAESMKTICDTFSKGVEVKILPPQMEPLLSLHGHENEEDYKYLSCPKEESCPTENSVSVETKMKTSQNQSENDMSLNIVHQSQSPDIKEKLQSPILSGVENLGHWPDCTVGESFKVQQNENVSAIIPEEIKEEKCDTKYGANDFQSSTQEKVATEGVTSNTHKDKALKTDTENSYLSISACPVITGDALTTQVLLDTPAESMKAISEAFSKGEEVNILPPLMESLLSCHGHENEGDYKYLSRPKEESSPTEKTETFLVETKMKTSQNQSENDMCLNATHQRQSLDINEKLQSSIPSGVENLNHRPDCTMGESSKVQLKQNVSAITPEEFKIVDSNPNLQSWSTEQKEVPLITLSQQEAASSENTPDLENALCTSKPLEEKVQDEVLASKSDPLAYRSDSPIMNDEADTCILTTCEDTGTKDATSAFGLQEDNILLYSQPGENLIPRDTQSLRLTTEGQCLKLSSDKVENANEGIPTTQVQLELSADTTAQLHVLDDKSTQLLAAGDNCSSIETPKDCLTKKPNIEIDVGSIAKVTVDTCSEDLPKTENATNFSSGSLQSEQLQRSTFSAPDKNFPSEHDILGLPLSPIDREDGSPLLAICPEAETQVCDNLTVKPEKFDMKESIKDLSPQTSEKINEELQVLSFQSSDIEPLTDTIEESAYNKCNMETAKTFTDHRNYPKELERTTHVNECSSTLLEGPQPPEQFYLSSVMVGEKDSKSYPLSEAESTAKSQSVIVEAKEKNAENGSGVLGEKDQLHAEPCISNLNPIECSNAHSVSMGKSEEAFNIVHHNKIEEVHPQEKHPEMAFEGMLNLSPEGGEILTHSSQEHTSNAVKATVGTAIVTEQNVADIINTDSIIGGIQNSGLSPEPHIPSRDETEFPSTEPSQVNLGMTTSHQQIVNLGEETGEPNVITSGAWEGPGMTPASLKLFPKGNEENSEDATMKPQVDNTKLISDHLSLVSEVEESKASKAIMEKSDVVPEMTSAVLDPLTTKTNILSDMSGFTLKETAILSDEPHLPSEQANNVSTHRNLPSHDLATLVQPASSMKAQNTVHKDMANEKCLPCPLESVNLQKMEQLDQMLLSTNREKAYTVSGPPGIDLTEDKKHSPTTPTIGTDLPCFDHGSSSVAQEKSLSSPSDPGPTSPVIRSPTFPASDSYSFTQKLRSVLHSDRPITKKTAKPTPPEPLVLPSSPKIPPGGVTGERSSDSEEAFETPESTTPVKSVPPVLIPALQEVQEQQPQQRQEEETPYLPPKPEEPDLVPNLESTDDPAVTAPENVSDSPFRQPSRSFSVVFDEDKPIASSGAYNLDSAVSEFPEVISTSSEAPSKTRRKSTDSVPLSRNTLSRSLSLQAADFQLDDLPNSLGGSDSACSSLRRTKKARPASLKKKAASTKKQVEANDSKDTTQPFSGESQEVEVDRNLQEQLALSPPPPFEADAVLPVVVKEESSAPSELSQTDSQLSEVSSSPPVEVYQTQPTGRLSPPIPTHQKLEVAPSGPEVPENPAVIGQSVRLEFDYSEESREGQPPSRKGKKPAGKMPLRKPKPKKTVEKPDAPPGSPSPIPNDVDDIPISKGSYTYNLDNWDDPNFNPFSSSTKSQDLPQSTQESLPEPPKPVVQRSESPAKAPASFEISAEQNGESNKPAKKKKTPLKTVKKSPKRSPVTENGSEELTILCKSDIPPVIASEEHATDEEKLASSVSSQKWTCMAVDLEHEKQDYPQPSDLTSFVAESQFHSSSDDIDFGSSYSIEYMEKTGKCSPIRDMPQPQSMYLMFEETQDNQGKTVKFSDSCSAGTDSNFDEIDPSVCSVKLPLSRSPPIMQDNVCQPVERSRQREEEAEVLGSGKMELGSPEDDYVASEALLSRISHHTALCDQLSYLEPDLAEKNPQAFAQKLQSDVLDSADLGLSHKSLYSRSVAMETAGSSLLHTYKQPDFDAALQLAREEIAAKERETLEWKKKYEESRCEVVEMRKIVAEYEKTIAQMIEDEQREKSVSNHTVQQLILEKEQALSDLNSVEKSLADLFRRYEKMKDVLEGFRKNEDVLKKCAQEYLARVKKEEQRYHALKIHAEEKLDRANSDIAQVRSKSQQEQVAYQASLRKEQLRIDALERTLEQKNKEIEELTKICDELIAKMGKS
ncbi:transforming acidic coiled-coil-containing protein 2 isoform X2 [Eleutherodactylus coqui]|uniref:transforming acidic coiled-coil-containing protein 2 isoform X2 n=1 Tax=Eleutherodactylus coqui TaxID=57060 RepID=UPI0034622C98